MSINKIKLIKAEIERLKESLPWGSCASQISMECNCKNEAYNEVLSFIDSLEEEPVSNDLEEAARRIATRHSHITGDTYYANDAWFFKKGAQWQKQQTIDKACEFLEEHLLDFWTQKITNTDYFIEDFKKAMKQ